MNQDMMSQLSQMQEKLQKAQEDVESCVVDATAGGGAVTISINGAYKVVALKIAPEAIDPDDAGMLEDLITAAFNEAMQQVQAFHADQLSGLNLPGLGAGGPAPGGAPPLNRAARRGKR